MDGADGSDDVDDTDEFESDTEEESADDIELP